MDIGRIVSGVVALGVAYIVVTNPDPFWEGATKIIAFLALTYFIGKTLEGKNL